jgi:hypothetical protein
MKSGLSDCGTSTPEPTQLLWSPSGLGSVELIDLDGTPYGRDDTSVHLVFVDECDTSGEYLDEVTTQGGQEISRKERIYVRGSICLKEIPPPDDPDVVEAADCRTEWCEDNPPEALPCVGD